MLEYSHDLHLCGFSPGCVFLYVVRSLNIVASIHIDCSGVVFPQWLDVAFELGSIVVLSKFDQNISGVV